MDYKQKIRNTLILTFAICILYIVICFVIYAFNGCSKHELYSVFHVYSLFEYFVENLVIQFLMWFVVLPGIFERKKK